jgi:hypothetical protein
MVHYTAEARRSSISAEPVQIEVSSVLGSLVCRRYFSGDSGTSVMVLHLADLLLDPHRQGW